MEFAKFNRVIAGYRPVLHVEACPYCGCKHYALEDDGNPDSLLVRCWCGATARVQRDDPDVAGWPGAW